MFYEGRKNRLTATCRCIIDMIIGFFTHIFLRIKKPAMKAGL
jgi:hypothetical protein